ncbi:hypothetical protein LOZ66_006950, partial [Ophidiomyces ophidiicola]
AFIIDLDLAIKENREDASGARGKTGTRAFMAIGVLLDEQHSFMHDLESFFWVLFWICIHYEGPGKGRVVKRFEKWNYMDTEELAKQKVGTVDEAIFMRTISTNFTPYYEPLIPHVNRLRREVFLADKPWRKEDIGLYSRIRKALQDAQAAFIPEALRNQSRSRPYCTHRCLLGLSKGGPLDEACPKVADHGTGQHQINARMAETKMSLVLTPLSIGLLLFQRTFEGFLYQNYY